MSLQKDAQPARRPHTRRHTRRAALGLGVTCAMIALSACGLDDFEETLVDEATIPGTVSQGSPLGLDYGAGFDGVDLAQTKNFNNQGVSPKDVDGIFVRSVRIEGIEPPAPAQPRLDVILESVQLWVEAEGLPRRVVATGSQFPSPAYIVDLDVVSDLNLKDYAVAPRMTVGTDVTIKTQPRFESTLRTTITLLVDVNIPVL